MKFEFEEFETIEDVLIYLVSVAPYMKQILPISSYKGYVFSMVPITPLSGETLLMIYTKGNLEHGMYEFDISVKKHKLVNVMERADKNYFIVITPKRDTIADVALSQISSTHRFLPLLGLILGVTTHIFYSNPSCKPDIKLEF